MRDNVCIVLVSMNKFQKINTKKKTRNISYKTTRINIRLFISNIKKNGDRSRLLIA